MRALRKLLCVGVDQFGSSIAILQRLSAPSKRPISLDVEAKVCVMCWCSTF